MKTAELRLHPSLSEKINVDVCVVGAGISGLTTAYLLSREGKSVVVLDDGPIAAGETERTTAHLVSAIDDRYYELERLHGEKGARLVADSHRAAIDRVEEIVAQEQIDCGFERLDGHLFLPPGESTEILDLHYSEWRASFLANLAAIFSRLFQTHLFSGRWTTSSISSSVRFFFSPG